MSNPGRRGPRPLSEIVGELFTVRGYGRLRVRRELEDAWNAAVGEPYCHQTRLGEVRRGVLSVTVAHSTLLEELAAFRKPALLAALRSGAPTLAIRDIQFRVGAIVFEAEPTAVTASNPPAVHREAKGLRPSTPSRGARGREAGVNLAMVMAPAQASHDHGLNGLSVGLPAGAHQDAWEDEAQAELSYFSAMPGGQSAGPSRSS